MVHRCSLITNAGKDKDALRLSSEKGAKLLPKKSLIEVITDKTNDSKVKLLNRSKTLPANNNKQKSLSSSSSSSISSPGSRNSRPLPRTSPIHSTNTIISRHQQSAVVRVSRTKYTKKNNESLPSSSSPSASTSSTARSGLRSSSLESCRSISNIIATTTNNNSNNNAAAIAAAAKQSDITGKKKTSKKPKPHINLKKSSSVENVCTALQRKSSEKDCPTTNVVQKEELQMPKSLPLSFICSLPLDRLSGILDHLKSLNIADNKEKLTISAADHSNDLEEVEEKNSSNLIKCLCLYCDKKFSTQKLRFKHTERFHTLAKDRRSSSRNPNLISAAAPASIISPSPPSISPISATTATATATTTVTCLPIINGCSFCNKSQKLQCTAAASDLDLLFYHMIDQHSDKYFGCKLCAIRFQNIDKLDKHMRVIHQDFKLINRSKTSEKSDLIKIDWEKASSMEPIDDIDAIANNSNSGKFENETNQANSNKPTRRQKMHPIQSNQRKVMTSMTSSTSSLSLSSTLVTRSLSQMSSNGGNITPATCSNNNSNNNNNNNNNNITTVTNSGGNSIFGNDETILSRLGVTQNRLPHGRKGIRNRRQTSSSEISLKSDCSTSGGGSNVVCSGISMATVAATKTRSKIGSKMITSAETTDTITFRTPTLINNRIETLSCTFDDDFYEKVNLNVRNNLSCHLDGKIDDGPSPSIHPIPPISAIRSTVVKSPISNDSEIHAATSLAAITAFPTLLTADQYGCDIGSTKIKRPITKHSWKWKWDSVKKYKYVNEGGKFVKKIKQPMVGLRDLSKLDMWTQLTMRQKHEFTKKHTSNEIAQIGESSREEKQRQIEQLNSILDNRLLPQIVLEQNEQTIIKVEIDEDKTVYAVVSTAEGTTAAAAVAAAATVTTTQALIAPENQELTNQSLESSSGFPFNLNLIPLSSSNRSIKRTVILSGEWARPRCYLCFGCGAKFDKLKALDEHKMFRHPHVYSTHYEIVGRELIEGNLYKHFFIPSKALNRHYHYHRGDAYNDINRRMIMYKKTDENLSREGDESLDSLHSISASCIETFSSSKSSDDFDIDTKIISIGTNSTSSSLLEVVPSSPSVVSSTSLLYKNDASGCNNENGITFTNSCSASHNCTKCNRKCNGVLELYRHMLDCSGDYAWFMAKKRKYRYYGSKKRRPFNKQNVTALRMYRKNKIKEEQSKQTTTTTSDGGGGGGDGGDSCVETPKKKSTMSPSTPRPRPSDAESIKKMLENLPAKRVCREIIPNATKPKSRKLNKITQQIKNIAGNSSSARKLQLKNLKIKSKNSTKTTKTLTAISKNILRSHKLRNLKKITTDIKQMKKKTRKFVPETIKTIIQMEDTSTTLSSSSLSMVDNKVNDDLPTSLNTNEMKSKKISKNKTDDKSIVRTIGVRTKNFVKQIKKTFQSNKLKLQNKKEKYNNKNDNDFTKKLTKHSIVRKLSFEKCEEDIPAANVIKMSSRDEVDNGSKNEKNDKNSRIDSNIEELKDCNNKSDIKNQPQSSAETISTNKKEDPTVIENVQDINANEATGDSADKSTNSLSSNQVSPTTKRRSKKINDCIAMLTGKLQEKMGKDLPTTVNQDAGSELIKGNDQGVEISPSTDQKIPKRKAQSRRIVKADNNVENDSKNDQIAVKETITKSQESTIKVEKVPINDTTPPKRKAQTRRVVPLEKEKVIEEKVPPPKPQLKCKPVESLMQQPIIVNLPSEHLQSPIRQNLNASAMINEIKTNEILTPPEIYSISAKLAQISSNVTISKQHISKETNVVPAVNSIIPSIEITPIKIPQQPVPKNVIDPKMKSPLAQVSLARHSKHLNIPFVSNAVAPFCTTISSSPATIINIPDIPSGKSKVTQIPLRTSNNIDMAAPLSHQIPPLSSVPTLAKSHVAPAVTPKPPPPPTQSTRPCIPKRRQTISVAPNEFIFGLNPVRMNSYNDFPFEIEVPLDLSKKSNKSSLSPKRTTSLVLPPAPTISSSTAPFGLPKIKQNKETTTMLSKNSYNQSQIISPPQPLPPQPVIPSYSMISAPPTNQSTQIFPFHSNVELLKIPQVRNPAVIPPVVQKPKRNTSKRNKKTIEKTSTESYLQQSQQELTNLLMKNTTNSDQNSISTNIFQDNRIKERRLTAAELKEQINDHINDAISSVINAAVQEQEEEQRKLEKAAEILKNSIENISLNKEVVSVAPPLTSPSPPPPISVVNPPVAEILLPPSTNLLITNRSDVGEIVNSTTTTTNTQPINLNDDINRNIPKLTSEKQSSTDFPTSTTTTSTVFSEIVKQKNPPDKAAADTTTPQDNLSSENTTESQSSKETINLKPKRRSTRRKTVDCKNDLSQQNNEVIVNTATAQTDFNQLTNVEDTETNVEDSTIPLDQPTVNGIKEKLKKPSSTMPAKLADSTEIKTIENLENTRKTRSKLPSPDTTANTNTTSSANEAAIDKPTETTKTTPNTTEDTIEKPSTPIPTPTTNASSSEKNDQIRPNSPQSTRNSTQKKQRRRRKNELAAIVADQLLESFKEVDKSRLDDLKKLENLAYEKSEDLLLTGMRLMSTTKRKTTNNSTEDISIDLQKGNKQRVIEKQATSVKGITGKKNSKKLIAKKTIEDDEFHEIKNETKNTQKSNSSSEMPSRLTFDKNSEFKNFGTYRLSRDSLQLPFPSELQTPPATPAKAISTSISNTTPDSVDAPPIVGVDQGGGLCSGGKKTKKKQLKKRDKSIENENINILRSSLESVTIGIEDDAKRREKSDSNGKQSVVFDYHKQQQQQQQNTTDVIQLQRNPSSILRPSILAATLDHNTSAIKEVQCDNNTALVAATTANNVDDLPSSLPNNNDNKSKEPKTITSSRDPRLNKNIHNDENYADFLTHRESRLASLRQRRNANFPAFNQRGRLRSSSSRQSIDDRQQQKQQKTNSKSTIDNNNDDDDEDNYLCEIAKKVNENIMSAEDKDFNLANDGFELANTFLIGSGSGGDGGPYPRPSTSMSVCSAPNLNDDRSINFDNIDSDENTNTEIIDMDLDDDMSVYTTFSQDVSRGGGNRGGRRHKRRRRRRSILLNRKPKKTNPNDLTNEKFDCTLCKKTFYKSTALMKHQMTLAHVSKVSEQEYLNSTAAANRSKTDGENKITVVVIEKGRKDNDNSCIKNSSPHKRNETHSMKQQSSSIPPVQISNGEDKRQQSPCKMTNSTSRTTTTTTPLENESVKQQQQQQPLQIRQQQQQQQLQNQPPASTNTAHHQPYIPLNSVLNQAAIEVISSPEQNNCERPYQPTTTTAVAATTAHTKTTTTTAAAAAAANPSSRLTLNPDERLFFECCNILKGSETPLVERSYPQIPDSNNSSYVYDFQVKPVTPKSTSERYTYLKTTNESRNIAGGGGGGVNGSGSGGAVGVSRKDCNYPSIDVNQFSDISSDSNPAQAPAAVLPDSYNMHLPASAAAAAAAATITATTTDIKNPSNLSGPPPPSAILRDAVQSESRIDHAEPLGAPTIASLPSATARTFVNQPSQLDEYGTSGYAVPSSSSNFHKQNFTSPLHSASSQGSTITTTCRLKTKAAMKGYDNLKVSIPTIGLDMEQALERSPRPGCKLTALAEIALGNEKPMQSYPAVPSHHIQEAAATNQSQLKSKINHPDTQQQSDLERVYHDSSATTTIIKRRELDHPKSLDIQLEQDECIPVPVIENKTIRCLSSTSAKDIYEFDDSENTPSSKAIMPSSFVKAATEAENAGGGQKKVIVIPERPFKNIGLEEKEPIKFQKPEAPPSPINHEDNSSSSTVSYSDRDDFVYGSLNGGDDDDDDDDEEDDDDNDDDNDEDDDDDAEEDVANDATVEKDCNLNLEDESSDSSAATAKTYENKSHIMGRIFKNVTTKSKVCIEKMKDSPLAYHNNEKIQPPPPPLQPLAKQIPKQDLDRLFDKLRGVTENRKNITSKSQQQEVVVVQQEKNETTPPMITTTTTTTTTPPTNTVANDKKPTQKSGGRGKGRPQKTTRSTSTKTTTITAKPTNIRKELSTATTTPKVTKNKKEITQLHSELGMSPEEIAELIGEGQRKSQRRCAVNRQKKLVEMWSSDEYEEFLSTKDIFALIEEKEQKQTKRKRKLSTTSGIVIGGSGGSGVGGGNSNVNDQQTQSSNNGNEKKSAKTATTTTTVTAAIAKSTRKSNTKTKTNDQQSKFIDGSRNNEKEESIPRETILDEEENENHLQKKKSIGSEKTKAQKITQCRRSSALAKQSSAKSSNSAKKSKKSETPISADSDSDFELENCRGNTTITTTTTATGAAATTRAHSTKSQSIRNRRKTITGKIEIEKQPRGVGKKAIAALKNKIAMDSEQEQQKQQQQIPSTTATMKTPTTTSKTKGKSNQNINNRNGNKFASASASALAPPAPPMPQLRPQARRKRVASEMLYYWSSSSDEEFGRIETPQDDEDDLDDGEHYQQHGWIVGDSHKKLVTLLAIAKGNKKVDDCGVKEINSKKKN